MFKHELRKYYLQKRIDLSDQEKATLDMKIKSRFENYLPDYIKTVHTYISIPSKDEVDTWPIIYGLWEKNIQVAVPIMDPDKNILSSYQLTRETQLKVNGWKVPEPVDSKLIKNTFIDAVVVPLLSFDLNGNRVGYGKGFYDSFLSSLDKKVIKIGLSYFPAIEKISDPDPWDIPLDVCITPDQLFKF